MCALQRVGKKIGNGENGELFQAWVEESAELVALKKIPIKIDDVKHQETTMVTNRSAETVSQ